MTNDIASAKKTIEAEIKALKVMEETLGEDLSKALDLMQHAKGRVIVTGMGKSGHIGKKIAATMASTGTPSFFVHPGEASHGDLGMLTESDVVLAISNGGESKELSDILVFCKRYGIPLISVTKNPDSSLGRAGDVLLKLPNAPEACPLGLAPTSSTTATLVLGDILAVALLERKGFSKTDYQARHPGGKLGSVLRKVSDLMHGGDAMPVVEETASMEKTLLTMTSKMLGCVAVVDKNGDLSGLITDGDLRRFISADMFNKKITDLMTKNPVTVGKDTLIAEALNIMDGKEISQLVVKEGTKPVGVLHLHDCLKVGAA